MTAAAVDTLHLDLHIYFIELFLAGQTSQTTPPQLDMEEHIYFT